MPTGNQVILIISRTRKDELERENGSYSSISIPISRSTMEESSRDHYRSLVSYSGTVVPYNNNKSKVS